MPHHPARRQVGDELRRRVRRRCTQAPPAPQLASAADDRYKPRQQQQGSPPPAARRRRCGRPDRGRPDRHHRRAHGELPGRGAAGVHGPRAACVRAEHHRRLHGLGDDVRGPARARRFGSRTAAAPCHHAGSAQLAGGGLMIVVMKPEATREDVDHVVARIEELGLASHLIEGAERTVVGVVGKTYPELRPMFEVLNNVDEVVPISKPYKLSSREFNPPDTIIDVKGVRIGGGETVVMAGPCSVESEEQLMATARAVKAAGAHILRGGAFKPRTSPYQFRGLGLEGLKLLKAASQETGMPVITEVMTPEDVNVVGQYADILQIGARNMQNYHLLEECGRSDKPVMLKRGLSGEIQEWLLCAEYIIAQGNRQVMLCERGIRTFETATRNTMDVSAIPLIKRLSHLPIIGDPSHGTGKWYLVEPMAKAVVAAGADGVMVEVHPNPDHALSDGAQSLTFESFDKLMASLERVGQALGRPLAGVAAGA